MGIFDVQHCALAAAASHDRLARSQESGILRMELLTKSRMLGAIGVDCLTKCNMGFPQQGGELLTKT